MVVRALGIGSVAKMLGAIYGTFGLIAGGIISIVAMFGGAIASQDEMGAAGPLVGLLFGVGAIIILPIVYGLMGAVAGALAALLYNVFAGVVGGIELRVDSTAAVTHHVRE